MNKISRQNYNFLNNIKNVYFNAQFREEKLRNMTFDTMEKAKGSLCLNFSLCIIVECHGDRITM